jgi:hypothetical protein
MWFTALPPPPPTPITLMIDDFSFNISNCILLNYQLGKTCLLSNNLQRKISQFSKLQALNHEIVGNSAIVEN